MGYENMIKLLDSQEFLDKLYGFAYKRCSDSHTAEDLCSEIILRALSSARRNPQIEHIHAYIWAVARRTYADLCERRKAEAERLQRTGVVDNAPNIQTNPIEKFLENEDDKRRLKAVLRNITFLSKIYRDVMVLYYIDGMKILEIAEKLSISETAVKQRLFSARNLIKEEAETMQTNVTLKPIDLEFIGAGNPLGNDPRNKAERAFSKNLVFLCRNQALTAKEISEKLNTPLPYVEDEIEIQLKGENASYGLLRRVGKDRYITNFLILDIHELEAGTRVYTKHLKTFCDRLSGFLKTDAEKILHFPFLSKQTELPFIMWTLIPRAIWKLDDTVRGLLKTKHLKGIELVERDFSVLGIAVREETFDHGFYGCNGASVVIRDYDLYGYSSIFVSNLSGKRLDPHFFSAHHILTDPLLLITVRSIGGLPIDSLTEDEKEIAAKAIECGYLRKSGNLLEPKIIVFKEELANDFTEILSGFESTIQSLAETIASELSGLIKQYVPKHLLNEYAMFNMAVSTRFMNDAIEACITEGLLTVPDNRLCAEGVLMTVK